MTGELSTPTSLSSSMDEYWRAALDLNIDMFREDWNGETERPVEPLKFKPYRGLPRFPLPDRVPPVLGDVRAGFRAFAQPSRTARPSDLDPRDISSLLYYTFGMWRLDLGRAAVWPYHRVVPSPRAYFPIELYCWLPATQQTPPGLYYYDPPHHCLVLLRAGDHRPFLSAATAAPLDGARAVLLLSALLWKNSWLYRNYTYRVVPQEAGILAGQALMVAGTFGLRGRVHHRFVDAALDHLLGLESPDEIGMLVLPLYRSDANEGTPEVAGETTAAEPVASLPPLTADYLRRSRLDPTHCRRMLAVHQNTLIHAASAIEPSALRARPDHGAGGAAISAPPDPASPPVELVDVLRSRTSGMWVFNSPATPVPIQALWQSVRYVLDRHDSDVVGPDDPPPVDCYVLPVHVEGLPSGIYSLTADRPGLALVRPGPAARWLQDLHTIRPPQVNYLSANFVCFLVVDRLQASREIGDRAFRVLAQEAGIVAQRLCTMSASVGLTARVHNGYQARRISALLGLDPVRFAPLFQVIVGRSRPNARYQTRIAV
ncbi:MAG: SagB-type dehydrogenase protein [Marmoricola sp.]|jgi:SagB-type dehydrogenase family enzyme|nr:SagB-type dehydrogenase protein [Marmoricola sp.]